MKGKKTLKYYSAAYDLWSKKSLNTLKWGPGKKNELEYTAGSQQDSQPYV